MWYVIVGVIGLVIGIVATWIFKAKAINELKGALANLSGKINSQ